MSAPKTASEILRALEAEAGDDPAKFFHENPAKYEQWRRASRANGMERPGQERSQPRPKTAVEQAVTAYRQNHRSASEKDAIRAVFKADPALYDQHKRDTRYRGWAHGPHERSEPMTLTAGDLTFTVDPVTITPAVRAAMADAIEHRRWNILASVLSRVIVDWNATRWPNKTETISGAVLEDREPGVMTAMANAIEAELGPRV